MTWKAGVDALSFGGTKNGLMGVEAVIQFDPAKAWEFELRRKRGGHLFSKHRYLSAQMEAYLTDGLWLEMARAANARAASLSRGIAALPGGRLDHPTEANEVFAAFPARGAPAGSGSEGAQYYLWSFADPLEPDAGWVRGRCPGLGAARVQLGDFRGGCRSLSGSDRRRAGRAARLTPRPDG
jgi:threonine aldolase